MRALFAALPLLCAGAVSAAPVADAQAARTLSSLVAIEVARDARFDVLATADLREVVALEGEKQALGCDVDSQSCLAEVAGAMGARFVVLGQLGALADTLVLTLSLYDSEEGRAPGRVVVKGADAAEISDGIPDAVTELMTSVKVPETEGAKTRLLVLDIRPLDDSPAETSPEPPAAHDAGLPLLLLGGGALAALGALGIAGGGVGMGVAVLLDQQALDEEVQTKRNSVYDQRDLFGYGGAALAATGGVVLAAGVGIAVFHLSGARE